MTLEAWGWDEAWASWAAREDLDLTSEHEIRKANPLARAAALTDGTIAMKP